MLQTVSGFLNRLIFGRTSKPDGESQQLSCVIGFDCPFLQDAVQGACYIDPRLPVGPTLFLTFVPCKKVSKTDPSASKNPADPC